jgi:hypothetical protein
MGGATLGDQQVLGSGVQGVWVGATKNFARGRRKYLGSAPKILAFESKTTGSQILLKQHKHFGTAGSRRLIRGYRIELTGDSLRKRKPAQTETAKA